MKVFSRIQIILQLYHWILVWDLLSDSHLNYSIEVLAQFKAYFVTAKMCQEEWRTYWFCPLSYQALGWPFKNFFTSTIYCIPSLFVKRAFATTVSCQHARLVQLNWSAHQSSLCLLSFSISVFLILCWLSPASLQFRTGPFLQAKPSCPKVIWHRLTSQHWGKKYPLYHQYLFVSLDYCNEPEGWRCPCSNQRHEPA